jgi:hypothetical protein
MSGQRMDSERQAERIARLEAQLSAALAELSALRHARDVAIRLATWPRELRTDRREGR